MKKTYVKPQLWTEMFQPADAIAGSCQFEVGFGDGSNPAVNPCSDKFGFFATELVCFTLWHEGNDKSCYHTSANAAGYFAS